jgi:uncharacterized protein YjbJ (UPF0337 family)
MISQICKSLLTIGLASFFFFTLVFGFAVEKSWAANSFTQMLDFSHTPIATMEEVKAASKELEGKTQEAIGNVMGDANNQIIGKARQAAAAVQKTTENIKDGVKLPERVKAASKDFEGKTQEAIGNLTGDRKAQIAGKAKQVESKTHNLMEDAKDKVKSMFE